jgi:hypothetical protein
VSRVSLLLPRLKQEAAAARPGVPSGLCNRPNASVRTVSGDAVGGPSTQPRPGRDRFRREGATLHPARDDWRRPAFVLGRARRRRRGLPRIARKASSPAGLALSSNGELQWDERLGDIWIARLALVIVAANNRIRPRRARRPRFGSGERLRMHRARVAGRDLSPAIGELRGYAGACFGDEARVRVRPPSGRGCHSRSRRRRWRGMCAASTSSSASEITARATRSPSRAPGSGTSLPAPRCRRYTAELLASTIVAPIAQEPARRKPSRGTGAHGRSWNTSPSEARSIGKSGVSRRCLWQAARDARPTPCFLAVVWFRCVPSSQRLDRE